MNRLFITALFLLNSLFIHAAGADNLGEVFKQAIESINGVKINENFKSHSSKDTAHRDDDSYDNKSNKNQNVKKIEDHHSSHKPSTIREAFSDVASAVDVKNYLFNIDWKFWIFSLIKIIIIISFSIFIWQMSNKAAQRYLKSARLLKKVATHSSSGTQALIKTLAPIIKSVFHWILIVLTILMVISALDVDIKPILVSFSIFGVAFAIGSQALMKDLVNGILMLFEGNVAVGDVVTVGDKTGTVESISLRALLLRHFTGELQTIPLSEVASLINCSRDYSVAVVQFVVDPKALIPGIQAALTETYQSMKKDAKFGQYICGELGTLAVKKMSEIGVTMSANIPIKPDPRKDFISEFNRRFYEQLQVQEVPLAYARV